MSVSTDCADYADSEPFRKGYRKAAITHDVRFAPELKP
jgi:hypothetical protein